MEFRIDKKELTPTLAISDVVNRKHKLQPLLHRLEINGTVTNNKKTIINYLND